LYALGIDYPGIGLNQSKIAHHNLANEFLGHRDFNAGDGTIRDLLDYLGRPDRQPNIVLSSEGFVNCLCNAGAREKFLAFIGTCASTNDRVCLVFTIRALSQYFDSWYVQRLKIGTANLNMTDYVKSSIHWIRNFFRALEELRNIVGTGGVVVFDVTQGDGDSVSALLSLLGTGDRAKEDSSAKRYNARLGLKKASLIYQLQKLTEYSQDKKGGGGIAPLRMAILKARDFPNEIFQYRVIPYDDANKIQAIGRHNVPPFLKAVFENALRPEPEHYQFISLSDINLSAEEMLFLKQHLPPELKSVSMLDAVTA
jgi:hypothetical protein